MRLLAHAEEFDAPRALALASVSAKQATLGFLTHGLEALAGLGEIFKTANGGIVEHWGVGDKAGVLAQLKG